MSNKGKRRSSGRVIRLLERADVLLANGGDLAGAAHLLRASGATFCRLRARCAGVSTKDAKKLEDLEKQNATPKELAEEDFQAHTGPGQPADTSHTSSEFVNA